MNLLQRVEATVQATRDAEAALAAHAEAKKDFVEYEAARIDRAERVKFAKQAKEEREAAKAAKAQEKEAAKLALPHEVRARQARQAALLAEAGRTPDRSGRVLRRITHRRISVMLRHDARSAACRAL